MKKVLLFKHLFNNSPCMNELVGVFDNNEQALDFVDPSKKVRWGLRTEPNLALFGQNVLVFQMDCPDENDDRRGFVFKLFEIS